MCVQFGLKSGWMKTWARLKWVWQGESWKCLQRCWLRVVMDTSFPPDNPFWAPPILIIILWYWSMHSWSILYHVNVYVIPWPAFCLWTKWPLYYTDQTLKENPISFYFLHLGERQFSWLKTVITALYKGP